ncbi:MAG: 2-oxoacid:acceptor oxidoreductase family protein [Gammaproteobacteria bacterium]|nr:2-oxoacid:acceptor oxidoreductase family protein [Gammaproteobacteria bacterium]
MFRIRFHGRGGQGMKTASRIVGTAFFMTGYEVQDAPRYGAERRGAPIFAYVRADKSPVNERGIIRQPDLVVVADDTLVGMPAAGVMQGIDEHTVLLINSHENADTWRQRLNTAATILILPAREDIKDRAELPYIGSRCAAACAVLTNVISRDVFTSALAEELEQLGEKIVKQNLDTALTSFELMSPYAGIVKQSGLPSAADYQQPGWINLPFDDAAISAPAIHASATSVKVRTGLWRTMRPVINYEKCSGCWWVCSTYCPDGAINVTEAGLPDIDYEHCKGCLVCVAQCPPQAIEAIPEHLAKEQEMSAADPSGIKPPGDSA